MVTVTDKKVRVMARRPIQPSPGGHSVGDGSGANDNNWVRWLGVLEVRVMEVRVWWRSCEGNGSVGCSAGSVGVDCGGRVW